MRTLVRRTTAPSPTSTGPLTRPEPFVPRSAADAGAASSGTTVDYAPKPDGRPDPGEVVWAWVPYEDDPAQGKDRPVLVIGRDSGTLLALQLTSQDHDLDEQDEARHGRHWMDVGTGGWDRERRPSEVRLDRLLRIEEHTVRREGAALDKAIFDDVIRQARTHHDL